MVPEGFVEPHVEHYSLLPPEIDAKTARMAQQFIDAGLITGDAEDQGHVFWASVYGFAGLILLGQISPEEGRRLHRLACRSAIAHAAP
jgi:hypothetical protein